MTELTPGGDKLSLDLIICTYNNAVLLDRTLSSITMQRVPPTVTWSVLVVDNNCTDDTRAVVEKYLSSEKAIPWTVVSEREQGLTPARLCGVTNTSSEWIAFVDDDCLLAEDWVEQAACFAMQHANCGAFGGRITLDFEVPPPPYVTSHRYAYAGARHGDTVKRRPWLAGAGMVVRRAALESCGWVDEQFLADRTGTQLVSGGDVEIGLRIAAQFEVWYNPNCRLQHIIPARRMTREYLRRIIFGLGASRHNAGALTWRGSYPTWVAYSALQSLGFAAHGLLQVLRESLRRGSGVDPAMAFGPARGWWSAMKGMLSMDTTERRRLIGCAAPARSLSRPTRARL